MRLNPELRRYLWLELSTARLVAMPAVLGVLLLLAGAWTWQNGAAAGGQELLEAVAGGATSCFALLVLFWGARLAAQAVVREVAERTWDQQRLSSAGAWTMTWGKLFGSTIYVWYGCVLLALAAAVALGLWQAHYGGVVRNFGASLPVVLLQLLLGLVAFAVLVTASVMLVAMTAVARRESARQLDVSIAQIVIIVVALFAFSALRDQSYRGTIVWFGAALDDRWFAVAGMSAFAAWAVVGLWRRMRVELQSRCWPVMWPLFVLFTAVFVAGFIRADEALTARVVVVALVVLLAGYVPAILEQLDPVRLRRLFVALRARDITTALRFMPLWLINHLLALVVVAIAVVVLLSRGDDAATVGDVDGYSFAAGTLVAAFLFVTRDLLLLVFAWLGRGGRRAFATWLLWMAVLYGLVPMILASFQLWASLPLVVPVWDVPFADFAVPPLLWPLLEVVAALVLLRWRWRRYAEAALASPRRGP